MINKHRYTLYFSLLIISNLIFVACRNNSSTSDNSKTNENVSVEDSIWNRADEIVDNITIPEFKDQSFNILDYGAVADGTTLNTQAFKDAIAASVKARGGKVIVPEGRFLTGPIHLKSNVNLHLQKNSEVLFSKNTSDYLPVVHTSYEGVELMNYSPLIYAKGQKNIAVTGEGVLNGQAGKDNWWPWCGAERYGHIVGEPHQKDSINLPRLRKMNENETAIEDRIFGEGHHLRPLFFETLECENVLVSGVTFVNAPFWVIHPLKSNNVTVDGVTVNSHGPNNDGCDPEYSKNVHITNCLFNTGDDCIAIKSGRNEDGRRVNIPSENIVVENCEMKDGHGGVVMGSEISAGVRNVYVRNCKMDSPNLERVIRIKTNTLRGGFVDGVFVKDVEVGAVKEAVLKVNTHYGIYANQEGEFMPSIKNIYLKNITVENGGEYGILIKGREQSLVKNVNIEDVSIKGVEQEESIEFSEPINYTNTKINNREM
ncbi:glycoside hydrolase family 28 protein [Mesonia sp.]|uniref:glycoside hydrolase family 28 protein n=1 Tax=Mesonia sp. TaxID=1960830 RepID=UPI0017538C6D|nr:glycoside hydrolase family 28 protein [Mesonia sp.]HIB36063.1 glycoside hydrolase family 28 protein [Mesonia sp.]HIO26267.1 glycoside hydrolase family 28 protein [Flavobacteriaceae bacterium]